MTKTEYVLIAAAVLRASMPEVFVGPRGHTVLNEKAKCTKALSVAKSLAEVAAEEGFAFDTERARRNRAATLFTLVRQLRHRASSLFTAPLQ